MTNKTKIVSIVIIIIILSTITYFALSQTSNEKKDLIKIGVITDLTGPAAYWGENAIAGSELALEELRAQGYNVEFIYEDYQLDTNNALSSAQKLVNVDQVDAIYSEFTPAAMSVGSFAKNLDILHLYVAAPVSPLKDAPNTYKSYLDYQTGCREVAKKFKEQGITNLGMLKANLEFGDICLAGVNEIYDDVIVENYNFGDKNFNTQILKLKNKNAEAVINVGFEGDTLNTLKALKENKLKIPYGTVDDTMSKDVLAKYPEQIKNSVTFGFTQIDPVFSQKLKEKYPNKDFATEYAAGFAYTHLKQMVKVIDACKNDNQCINEKLDQANPDLTIGFKKFNNHIAEIEMDIKQY